MNCFGSGRVCFAVFVIFCSLHLVVYARAQQSTKIFTHFYARRHAQQTSGGKADKAREYSVNEVDHVFMRIRCKCDAARCPIVGAAVQWIATKCAFLEYYF